jgi:DNA-binding Lrp family transcriptional regulator
MLDQIVSPGLAKSAKQARIFGSSWRMTSDNRRIMPRPLDAIDRRILRVLQADGRLANSELAKQVGLSPSPCLRRVKMLEDSGVIWRYSALLSGAAVGLPMTLYCRVTLDRQDKAGIEGFAKAIAGVPEVLECHLMAGSYDYLLKVAAASLDDYQRFQMQHLTPLPGVRNVVTEIPLKTIKGTSSLPV